MKREKPVAKFVHWIGDQYELYAMFNLPNGSTVSIHGVEEAECEPESPPGYIDWYMRVRAKKNCRMCWARFGTCDHTKAD